MMTSDQSRLRMTFAYEDYASATSHTLRDVLEHLGLAVAEGL